jgi:hypothetical protein
MRRRRWSKRQSSASLSTSASTTTVFETERCSPPEQDRLLDLAEANRLSVAELRRFLSRDGNLLEPASPSGAS